MSRPVGSASIGAARVASGDLLFISGQIAVDVDGTAAHPGDAGSQAAMVFAQIAAILAANGCTFADVVKLTTFLVDMRDLDAVRTARATALGGELPTATTVAVSALAKPGLRVEIEAIAAVPR